MTFTYSPVSSMCCERAAATSAIAVACGTPMPSTPLVVHADLLRRQRGGGDDAVRLDLLDALGDQLGLDRLLVDLLHLARRLVLGQLRDALEHLVRVLVAGEDALEVQDGEAAELAHD